jgi:arylsulfatase
MDPRNRDFYVQQFPVVDPAQWGGPGTFLEYGAGWAQVSTVPFRLFKGSLAEGGIRSPLVVSGPGVETQRGFFGLRKRRRTGVVLSVTDLTPTFLELAGVDHPSSWQGRPVAPLQGRSLLPLLAGEFRARKSPHEWLGFELGGQRALRRGAWKLVLMPPPFGSGDWRLYRIDRDPAELHDRAKKYADRKEELVALWEQYARDNGVMLPDPEPAAEGAADDAAQE